MQGEKYFGKYRHNLPDLLPGTNLKQALVKMETTSFKSAHTARVAE